MNMTVEVAAAILGISIDADRETIDKAWKARARLVHPDRFEAGSSSQDVATESMKQLNTAKEVMIANIGKPKPTASTSKPSNSSQNAKPSTSSTNASPSTQEPQYRPMTAQEEEEERVKFRAGQLQDEKDYLRAVVKSFAIYFGLFLIPAIATLVSIYILLFQGGDKSIPFIVAIVSGLASGFLWNKVAVRGYSFVDSIQKISAIKTISRRELRDYNRMTRRTRKN
jgi:hypothetical protein